MKNTTKKYDLIVIGAGSGGLVSAEFSAKLGAKVLLIEKHTRLGGDCLNTGCVPSKALLHGAATGMKFKAALKHVHDSIDFIEKRSDNVAHLEAQGIDVIIGEASFTSEKIITVNDENYTFKKAIIATGSTARELGLPMPKGSKNIRTNENFFEMRTQPKKLVIAGAGPIGLEMGTALAQFGTDVELLEAGDSILSFMSPASVENVKKNLHPRINVRTNTRLSSVSDKTVQVDSGGKKSRLAYDEVLLAIGRVPVMPNGMDEAGVEASPHGIAVDSHFRTSNKDVYAVGDVTLRQKFTHTAAESAAIALTHAMYGVNGRKNTIPGTPFSIFSNPEVAAVGVYGANVLQHEKYHKTYQLDYPAIDKAVTANQDGLMMVHADKKGMVLGAEIVGGSASELIGYFSLAISAGISLSAISQTIMPYPTLSLGLKQLAGQSSLDRLEKIKTPLNIVRKIRR